MNKLYILVPVLGLIAFYGVYWNFEKEYKQKQVAIAQQKEQDRIEKNKRDIAAREKAIKDAIEATEKRKQERLEKERIDEAKKKARLEAEDRRQRAYDDRKRTRDQLDRLKKDVDTTKAEISKLDEEKKKHLDEQAFLKGYVKQAEANVKYYYDLLDKLKAAEDERARLEAAAAAAAKKNG